MAAETSPFVDSIHSGKWVKSEIAAQYQVNGTDAFAFTITNRPPLPGERPGERQLQWGAITKICVTGVRINRVGGLGALVLPGLGRSSFWLCASPDAKRF